jgi:RNA polymerase sigma-70 factor (ECF subfamily)
MAVPAPAATRDPTLAEDFRDGRPGAAAEIRARVRRIVSARPYGIPGSEQEDLVQEVMTQLWQAVRRPGFDLAREIWPFVEVLAARRSIDWLRAKRPTESLDSDLHGGSWEPLAAALEAEKRTLARQALAALSASCRELIRLHAGLGRSYAEIAAATGRPEGALRVQLFRCIRRAREALARLAEPRREVAR